MRPISLALVVNINLATIINRKRKHVHHAPPAPTSRNEFVIPEDYAVTTSGEQFLLFYSGVEDKVLVNLLKLTSIEHF